MTQFTENATLSKLLLTPAEAARSLAICEKTLFNYTKAGDIPVVKIGRAVRYDPEDLRAWIERSKELCNGKSD